MYEASIPERVLVKVISWRSKVSPQSTQGLDITPLFEESPVLWQGEMEHVPMIDDSLVINSVMMGVVDRVFYLTASETQFVALYVDPQ